MSVQDLDTPRRYSPHDVHTNAHIDTNCRGVVRQSGALEHNATTRAKDGAIRCGSTPKTARRSAVRRQLQKEVTSIYQGAT